MLDIQILDTYDIYILYYIDPNSRTAAVCMGANEEETSMLLMQLKELAEKDNKIQTVQDAIIIEVIDECTKYSVEGEIDYKYDDQRYYRWTYGQDVYEGKSGFYIDLVSESWVTNFIAEKDVVDILIWLDNKLTKLIRKGISFKKTFSIKAALVKAYFIIFPDYYDKM